MERTLQSAGTVGSPQAMRRHFLASAGTSPRDHRAAFRGPAVAALT